MLFVAVDVDRGAVMKAWLVPSTTFAESAGTTDKAGRHRFRASMKAQTNDRWRPYRLEANELPPAVLSRLNDLEAGG